MRIAHNKTSDKIEHDIIEAYNCGDSSTVVSQKYEVHFSTVLNILRRHNIPIRKMRDAKKIYHYNENFFENIDTEEKAYWLGFILADGCVSIRNSYKKDLSINIKHSGHIHKFISSINGNNVVREYVWKNKKYESISIRCPKMIDDLMKLGLTPRKSLVATVPAIHKSLQPHFWRGVVDGDGSLGIYINKKRYNHKSFAVSLVGSKAVITGFVEFVQDRLGISLSVSPTRKIFYTKTTNKNAISIIKLLYGNSSAFMTRKHNLAIRMVDEWKQA